MRSISEEGAATDRRSIVEQATSLKEYQSATSQLNVATARMDLAAFNRFLCNVYDYPHNGRWKKFVARKFEAMLHVIRQDDETQGVMQGMTPRSGSVSFKEFSLAYRPMLKGTLEQMAAFSFMFFDVDFDGFLTKKEVGRMIEELPVGAHSEQDLLSLLAHFGGGKDFYTFEDYYEHVQANGIHQGLKNARLVLLGVSEDGPPVAPPRSACQR